MASGCAPPCRPSWPEGAWAGGGGLARGGGSIAAATRRRGCTAGGAAPAAPAAAPGMAMPRAPGACLRPWLRAHACWGRGRAAATPREGALHSREVSPICRLAGSSNPPAQPSRPHAATAAGRACVALACTPLRRAPFWSLPRGPGLPWPRWPISVRPVRSGVTGRHMLWGDWRCRRPRGAWGSFRAAPGQKRKGASQPSRPSPTTHNTLRRNHDSEALFAGLAGRGREGLRQSGVVVSGRGAGAKGPHSWHHGGVQC